VATVKSQSRALGAGGLAFAALIAFVVWSVISPPTYEIEYSVPGSPIRVVARYTPMHAYLAEYERSLVVVRADGARAEVKLFPDTGGYARAQLYETDGEVLYLKGYFDVVRIGGATGQAELVATAVPEGARYLGAFDSVRDVGWRFLVPSESPEQPLKPKGG
jgi:hypothetical protein